ncbi:hypothetical protein FKM82_022420 [Ascaphus truei]
MYTEGPVLVAPECDKLLVKCPSDADCRTSCYGISENRRRRPSARQPRSAMQNRAGKKSIKEKKKTQ